MSADFISLALPWVQQLSPYVPGKPIEELARELNLDPCNIVKLASNENPLGPSTRVLAAINQHLQDVNRYPDGNGFALKSKLAQRIGVSVDRLVLGNGSSDVLDMCAHAYLEPGSNVVFSQYSFAMYSLVAQARGTLGKAVKAKDYGHDLDAMLAAIDADTRVVYVANPNNPTGTWFGTAQWERFIAAVPEQVLVVLDEAYIEFALREVDLPDGLNYIERYPNLLVTRTLSKAYGLAGLRVGYGVGSPAVVDVLNRVRQPFNVNGLALVAAVAALDDKEHLARSLELNRVGKAQLLEGLAALGLAWVPSCCNFVMVGFGQPVDQLCKALLAEGVIVRPMAGYGLPNHLRVSVGLELENRRFLEAMAKVLGR